MIIFRFKTVFAAALVLCSCGESRSPDDVARIEELEAELEEAKSDSKSLLDVYNDAGPTRGDSPYEILGREVDRENAERERQQIEAERNRLEAENIRLEREKHDREMKDTFGQ